MRETVETCTCIRSCKLSCLSNATSGETGWDVGLAMPAGALLGTEVGCGGGVLLTSSHRASDGTDANVMHQRSGRPTWTRLFNLTRARRASDVSVSAILFLPSPRTSNCV